MLPHILLIATALAAAIAIPFTPRKEMLDCYDVCIYGIDDSLPGCDPTWLSQIATCVDCLKDTTDLNTTTLGLFQKALDICGTSSPLPSASVRPSSGGQDSGFDTPSPTLPPAGAGNGAGAGAGVGGQAGVSSTNGAGIPIFGGGGGGAPSPTPSPGLTINSPASRIGVSLGSLLVVVAAAAFVVV
ncbi:hypothetical protein Q8F55_004489 [Vanrija albida]|uniref:Extracellular membrane protein CFEM domain-containing protein n=1 Tax=Vanrija albida TaxID=181172 RepID=A0ABR3Q7Q0_9TREE